MKMAEKLGKDKSYSLLYHEAIKTLVNAEYFHTILMNNEAISVALSKNEIKYILDPTPIFDSQLKSQKKSHSGVSLLQKN